MGHLSLYHKKLFKALSVIVVDVGTEGPSVSTIKQMEDRLINTQQTKRAHYNSRSIFRRHLLNKDRDPAMYVCFLKIGFPSSFLHSVHAKELKNILHQIFLWRHGKVLGMNVFFLYSHMSIRMVSNTYKYAGNRYL